MTYVIMKVQFWVYRDSERLESFGRVDFLFVYEDCAFFDVIFMVMIKILKC